MAEFIPTRKRLEEFLGMLVSGQEYEEKLAEGREDIGELLIILGFLVEDDYESPEQLAESLGITKEEAQYLLDLV